MFYDSVVTFELTTFSHNAIMLNIIKIVEIEFCCGSYRNLHAVDVKQQLPFPWPKRIQMFAK